MPWVRLAEQNPPLRPDAAQPAVLASSSTTSAPGSRSRASRAVHNPENPPPTTTRSARSAPVRAGLGSGAPGWLVQKLRGWAPARARWARSRAAPAARSVVAVVSLSRPVIRIGAESIALAVVGVTLAPVAAAPACFRADRGPRHDGDEDKGLLTRAHIFAWSFHPGRADAGRLAGKR